MAYIHIAKSKGFGVEDAQRVQEKVGPRETIDGLHVQAVGLAADVAASTEFTECDADELYIR